MKLPLVTIILFNLTIIFCANDVKYAAIIYRHGDRTPVHPYPTDPWRNESLWPVKFGQLTNIGKRQQYHFGQWLRQRYSHLLSLKFDPSQIYVKSTDVDRTLMSAQANLAGMFPPVGDSIWDPQLMWQPIPVHTVPEQKDEILAMKKPCPVYDTEKEKMLNSKEYKKKLKAYQWLLTVLTHYTGNDIVDFSGIEYIYNTLYIESLYNFTLPDWTRTIYPDIMEKPACYSFTVSTGTPLLARLKVGPLLKEIFKHIEDISKKKEGATSISLYSAHDDTVGSVLNALNLFDNKCPVYTSAIIIEVVNGKADNSSESDFIRISYRNFTGIEEPYVLNIPNCGKMCPISTFKKLYSNLLTVSWEKECALNNIYLIAGLLILPVAILLYKGVTIYRKHKPMLSGYLSSKEMDEILYGNTADK